MMTYEYDLFFDVCAINVAGGVLREVAVTHHGKLLATVVVVQRDYQRVVVIHRLTGLIGSQVVHVERNRTQRDGLLESSIKTEFESEAFGARSKEPN
jgi:hypothetical protein